MWRQSYHEWLYLLTPPRAGQGKGCVFGSLWLSLNVTPFVQEHFHHANMASSSSQDQRCKTCDNRGNTKVHWLQKHDTHFWSKSSKESCLLSVILLKVPFMCQFHYNSSSLHTFFVPVLNVGSSCNEDRHQLLVSSCTCQCQCRVMVTLRLWRNQSFSARFKTTFRLLLTVKVAKCQSVLHVHLCQQRDRGVGQRVVKRCLQASVWAAGTGVWVRL